MSAAPHVQEAGTGLLTPEGLARLTASLVRAEMTDLISRGQMPRDAVLPLQDPRLTAAQVAELTIDEEGLGFDSLSRLGLVLRLNRFFGLSSTGVEDYLLVQRRLGDWVGLIAEHIRRMGPGLVLTFDTSGSSGPVKHVPHGIGGLEEEIRAHLAGPLADLPPGRVLAMVPPHHIYGFLFSVLFPALTGREVVDLHALPPTALARHAAEGDLVIGTPFTWDLVARTGIDLPPGVHGLTSAGPSTAATFVNSLARLTEIYGATETGGIATRTAHEAPFTLLPHLQREGEEIAGRPLQDRLDWLDEHRFHLLGRKDDVVQVAGVNVSPNHLRELILTVAGVAEASVRPGDGRLKAYVVPEPGIADATLQARLSALLSALPAPARPAPITFGAVLPRNAMGKLSDWGLAN